MSYEKEYFLKMLKDIETNVQQEPDEFSMDPTLEVERVMIKNHLEKKREATATQLVIHKMLDRTYPNTFATKVQRHSWHEKETVKTKPVRVKSLSTSRSFSAEHRKLKPASCLTPIYSAERSTPNLEIVGHSNLSTSPNSSVAEQPTKLVAPVKHPSSAPVSDRRTRKARSRAILEELQTQLSDQQSDIKTLVMELDNNLSLSSTETGSSTKVEGPATEVKKADALMAIQVDRKMLSFSSNDVIGVGTFSTVYRGKLLGMDVAIKSFKNVTSDKSLQVRHLHFHGINSR